jgi:hypothetical protein
MTGLAQYSSGTLEEYAIHIRVCWYNGTWQRITNVDIIIHNKRIHGGGSFIGSRRIGLGLWIRTFPALQFV